MLDELSSVLWAYKTTHKTTTGESPFALTFGHEAVVLAEVRMGMHWKEYFNEEQNDEQICLSLGLLAKKRKMASMRATEYQ